MRFFITLFAFFTVFSAVGQSVPNGDFEQWSGTGNYEEPVSWSTPNPNTAALSLFTVTKESGLKHTGSYSARLQTRSLLGMPIPGLLTLGTFSINMVTMEATIEGGIPFTHRPVSMSGYIQYDPKLGDECFVGVVLLRQNGSSWDTLGTGNYTTTQSLNTWTEFNIAIDYTSVETPTHLNIIILSSDRDDPQPNSTLYIDNLEFQYPIGVEESITSADEPRVYFGAGRLVFEGVDSDRAQLPVSLYSLDGRVVWSGETQRDGNTYTSLLLPDLQGGVYIVRYGKGDGSYGAAKIYAGVW